MANELYNGGMFIRGSAIMPDGSKPYARSAVLDIRSPGTLDRAVTLVRRGEPVCFPTDTVYGIGVHAYQAAAVERLYHLKGRPAHQAIPLLLPDAGAMRTACVDIPPIAWRLAARFWPGGLSLVLRRSPVVPDVVTCGGPTVAVRVPAHDWVRELCRRLGAPLAATSANLHGKPSPVSAEEVRDAFDGLVPLIVDGGVCQGGVASTVLDLTVAPPAILRPGPVTAQELEKIGGLQVD
ncbi:MAG: L-threonylcarbamoyladenylate synthase [Anaerolineae bacterium]|jgi:L-threonylcarbamoyladenylate synthase